MVFQSEKDDCGKATVRNYLSCVFRNKAYETAKLDYECKDFQQIEDELLDYGVKCTSYRMDNIWEVKRGELPCICQVKNGDDSHFVLVKSIGKKFLVLIDPQFGERRLSFEEWDGIYLGYVMVFEGNKELKKPKSITIIPKYGQLFYFLSFLCLTLFLCLSRVCMARKDGFLLSMIFFSLFMISLVLTNALGFTLRKTFENKTMLPYLEKTENKKDRKILSDMFQEEIKRYSVVVNSSSAILSLAFLLLFDNLYSSILVFGGLMFSLLHFLLNKKRSKINYLCSIQEQKFIRSRGESKRDKGYYLKASKRANEYLGEKVLIHVVEIRTLAALLRVITPKEDHFSISYFLFRLMTSCSISATRRTIFNACLGNEKKNTLRNSLSYPFGDFLKENEASLGYNKNIPGGDFNGTKENQGLPEQNQNKRKE